MVQQRSTLHRNTQVFNSGKSCHSLSALQFFLRWLPSWICMYHKLKNFLSFVVLRHSALGRSLVFSLLAASNNKYSLLLIFGLLVSFGLTPTNRWTQFGVKLLIFKLCFFETYSFLNMPQVVIMHNGSAKRKGTLAHDHFIESRFTFVGFTFWSSELKFYL